MATTPYCGSPPVPGSAAWNLDPILILALIIIPFLYFYRERGSDAARKAAFGAGWAALALALVSPLCNLSVALFSARVTQHMIITLIAAPLLVLAFEPSLSGHRVRRETSFALGSSLVFALVLWIWHMPEPYAATFDSDVVYWAMHLTLFGSAVLLWSTFLH